MLQGGATFEVGGTPGPLACRGVTGTITVVDSGANDANPVAGQYRLERVCLGTYTVTETVAPPGYALPADPDREVTVSAANLSPSIGTIGNNDVDDFHNRLGTIEWEKRDDQGNLKVERPSSEGRRAVRVVTTPTPSAPTTPTRSRSSTTAHRTPIRSPVSTGSSGSASAPTR